MFDPLGAHALLSLVSGLTASLVVAAVAWVLIFNPLIVLALLSLLSGLAASRLVATATGRSLKVLAVSEAVLVTAWGVCCLLPLEKIYGGHVAWGFVPQLFAAGGAILVGLGGFAYLVGSFIIGLFSKLPQEDEALGQ
jgi:hypothetical protein